MRRYKTIRNKLMNAIQYHLKNNILYIKVLKGNLAKICNHNNILWNANMQFTESNAIVITGTNGSSSPSTISSEHWRISI